MVAILPLYIVKHSVLTFRVEKAKQNFNVDNLDDPVENQFENEMPQQPD